MSPWIGRGQHGHHIDSKGTARKLVVNTFLTLDGVMQAPGGPEEDPTEGFAHGGWSVGYWDDFMGERMGESMGPGRTSPSCSGARGHEHLRRLLASCT